MAQQFTETERAILRIVQADLPDSLTPYADIARTVGCTEEEVLDLLSRLKQSGAIRRFGASIKHQKTGWNHNAMVGWKVAPELVEECGTIAARHSHISHVYYRPSAAPDWPYELYTMVHGRSEQECLDVAQELIATTPLREYAILKSLKELKKISMTYFRSLTPMDDKSRALFDKACQLIPGHNVDSLPLFIAEAHGSHIIDVDGREYIDFILSWGPMILGHDHPAVTAAVREAAGRGTSYGAPCPDEVTLAEEVVADMPSLEMVRMVNSGTEATMSALRLVRGVTGRDKVLKFVGCYHGHADPWCARRRGGRHPAGPLQRP